MLDVGQEKISQAVSSSEDDPIMLFEQLWDEIEALLRLDHPVSGVDVLSSALKG